MANSSFFLVPRFRNLQLFDYFCSIAKMASFVRLQNSVSVFVPCDNAIVVITPTIWKSAQFPHQGTKVHHINPSLRNTLLASFLISAFYAFGS